MDGIIILLLVVNAPRCWYGETIDHRSTIPVVCFYKSQMLFLGDNQIIFKLCWKLTNIDFKYEMWKYVIFIKSVGDSKVEILNDELS